VFQFAVGWGSAGAAAPTAEEWVVDMKSN